MGGIFTPAYGWHPARRKQLADSPRARGLFVLTQTRGGRVIAHGEHPNVITRAGAAAIAGLIIATGHTDEFAFIGIGEGTTAVVNTDTALEDEITTDGGERGSATLSRTTTTYTNDTARLVRTFTFTASFAVAEAGAFSLVSAGVMLSHQTFSAYNVVAADNLEVEWLVNVVI